VVHSTIGADFVGNDKADAVLTRDVFKGDQTSQAQSPLCIVQRCLVPSEPYQPSNMDGPHSGWQVVEDFLLLVGQQRAAGESIDQERRPEGLVQYPEGHTPNHGFLDSPAGNPVGNICIKSRYVHTGAIT
jgi:hypothetical protein